MKKAPIDFMKNNKLIAEFMTTEDGKLFVSPDGRCERRDYDEHSNLVKIEFDEEDSSSMKYHESWDWLMPVVERIENLGVSTDIHYYAAINLQELGIGICKTSIGNKHNSLFLGYKLDYDSSSLSESKIEAVYNSVLKFICWYNENKIKNNEKIKP